MTCGGGLRCPSAFSANSSAVTRVAAQSIGSGVDTAISWDTVKWNNGGLWDAGAPTFFTVPADGLWLIVTGVEWAANAASYRKVNINIFTGGIFTTTAQSVQDSANTVAGVTTAQSCSNIAKLVAGQQVQVAVRQVTGAGLNIIGGNLEMGFLGALT